MATYHMIPFIGNVQIGKSIGKESRFMVSREEGEEDIGSD